MPNDITPLEYTTVREVIHNIFNILLEREFECYQDGEFDFEFMEYCADDIIRLIKRQGGQI